MSSLARVVGLVICALGILGMLAPGALVSLTAPWLTPTGLWLAGALRVGIGVVLLLVARPSRHPAVLRVLGVIVIIAGLATPLFGVKRARMVVAWSVAQGSGFIRLWALIALVLGGYIVYAVVPRRRAA
jgi:hypothetical protein